MKPGVVVITGGSAGVGRATARAFAARGYRVALLARGVDRLGAACAELREAGSTALGIVADVADEAQVEAAAERVERELGPISVWVNNAANTVFAPVIETTAQEYRQVTAVTYLGTVHGTLAALRRMRPRNEGCIVQVGSALAYRSIPLQSAYCASKAAIRGFTDSLRSELIYDGCMIHLTMVHLSAFNTPQFDWARNKLSRKVQPVPPIFQPEVAADAILQAASHRRREWWVGWPAVKAILSSRLLPGVGDRIAADSAHHGQQTPERAPARSDHLDNLFNPVPGRFGAHGRFDDIAKKRSLQWEMSKHRAPLAAIAMALTVGAITAALLAGRSRDRHDTRRIRPASGASTHGASSDG